MLTITGYGRCTHEIKSRIATAKSTFNNFFHQHIGQKLRNKLIKGDISNTVLMLLKFEHFGREIRRTFKILQRGTGEWCWRSVGRTVWKMKKCYKESKRKWTSCINKKKSRLTGFVTSCIGPPFQKKTLYWSEDRSGCKKRKKT